jgi:hypothetical protein
VLNIIAELKPPNRAQTIEFLKGYGFLCLKYRESYHGLWWSDVPFSISPDYRFNIHHPYAEGHNYGSACDEADNMELEVCVFAQSPAACSYFTSVLQIVFMTVVRHCRIIGLFVKMPRSAFGAAETVRISKIESRLGTRTHTTQQQVVIKQMMMA